MSQTIIMVAFGPKKYLDEAIRGIDWHRRLGMNHPIDLWVDASTTVPSTQARIQTLPPVSTTLPARSLGWYYKTWVLRHYVENATEPFCLLDTYARVLRADLFDQAETMSRSFSLALATDPRKTLANDLAVGLGVAPEIKQELSDVPGPFPLWNTGVIFVSPDDRSRSVLTRMEERSREYLDRGISFREQTTLIQAVIDTRIAPLTLPENYNVRRPFINPAIVLHTRRYGHFYGHPEVDEPKLPLESWRHRIKAAIYRAAGIRTLVD